MHIRNLHLTFLSPAFLGNAKQTSQWRTPPIKALLRQWWRVGVAHELSFNVDRLRQREGALFGVAADGAESTQSKVRIRLSHWDEGKLKDWASLGTVKHPEVSSPVGSDLYLGYGPLPFAKGKGVAFKNNAAIQAGDSATFKLAFPDQYAPEITTALWLMDRYGSLGGRSRNGWGSLTLEPEAGTPALAGALDERLTLPWQDALRHDWPQALGTDGKGALIWQTRAFDDWKKLMQELARVKIGLRTQPHFRFHSGKDAPTPEARHWLSYPVTHHSVKPWGNNARLPNSLRFKVRPAPGNPKQCVGVIFHMPCLPPAAFRPDRHAITSVWQQVHAFLDKPDQKLTRISA